MLRQIRCTRQKIKTGAIAFGFRLFFNFFNEHSFGKVFVTRVQWPHQVQSPGLIIP